MSTFKIRNLTASINERIRAAEHGKSMADKAKGVHKTALNATEAPPPPNLYERIRARLAPLGGADDLEVPPRELGREPPRFG